MGWKSITAVGVTVTVMFFGSLFASAAPAAGCTAGAVDPATASANKPIAGYSGDQLANAAAIMNAATALGLDQHAQLLGVMTAMGESSLRVLDYGDQAGPDSRGLFQQRDNWGALAQRMDPTTSAELFFRRLVTVPNWEALPPTIAIHDVQINSDPQHYASYQPAAEQVVAGLSMPCTVAVSYTTKDGKPGAWGGYSNGQIPASALAPIPWDRTKLLRPDAAQALAVMDVAFRGAFGYDIPLNDAYRDLANQVEAKRVYGEGAATPGTSNHGWALAIDVGDVHHYVITYGSPEYLWLKANAPRYGWVHPDWAEPDGSGPHEAWHWEYVGVNASGS